MKKAFFLFFFFLFFLIFPQRVWGISCEDFSNSLSQSDLDQVRADCDKKIQETQNKTQTLNQEITLMNDRIRLTSLKIIQTQNQIKGLEQEIASLSGKIVRLDGSLNSLSKILLSRVTETYKRGRVDPLTLFFSSKNFSEFITNYRFLQAVQIHDREMLLAMEQTRTSYDDQKQLKEKKQADLEKLQQQLEGQKKQLNVQIADRKRLLDETKGKEANYQRLLALARAELEAILGILEGKGSEREIRKVSEGERIATIISGESCNSNGTHLHFIITKDGQTANPFGYLKSIDFENCSSSSCGSSDGDAFNPSGNWNWPISPKITFTQGYGDTWAVQHTWVGRIYRFHNGIDLQSPSLEVKAVKPGVLYWGSYVGNCTLRYVRLRHDEGNLDTYYLHVNF